MKYIVNLNTADQCDDGFEYDSIDEQIAGAVRLARSAHKYYIEDGIERRIEIIIGDNEFTDD
jgi:hypothetical protein